MPEPRRSGLPAAPSDPPQPMRQSARRGWRGVGPDALRSSLGRVASGSREHVCGADPRAGLALH